MDASGGSCPACDLASGRVPLPGGRIHRTGHWLVEHCVGPLGVGTLLVKPERHVTAVADLSDAEAAELGPLLRDTARVARDLAGAEQVYTCLWAHAGGVPGHVHYVVQPVRAGQIRDGRVGPRLQLDMFEAGVHPDPSEIEAAAHRARDLFGARPHPPADAT